MDKEVIKTLTEKTCASMRFRTKKEILEETPDINAYLDEILEDKRVKYVFTWQCPDGFLGRSFHGGWIPGAKLKLYNTGAETALRFLSEMGIPKDYPVVERCLNTLLKDKWNPDPWKWGNVYQPRIGLFGGDYLRAVVFAYFGIEEQDFFKTEIQRALDVFTQVLDIKSIESIIGTYGKKLYFKSIALPDIYYLKLLAFTKNWRNNKNTSALAKAMKHYIDLSPVPHIYIKCGAQLVAPAQIHPQDLKKSLRDQPPIECYWWMQTMELLARMGMIKQIPDLFNQVKELKDMLQTNGGFFPFRPATSVFEKWNCYTGLGLEDSWAKNRWQYDLTFRSLLILKYAEML